MSKSIGDTLKQLREKKYPARGGATICAEEFGVGRQQWYDWESGKTNPGARNQKKLAAFFGISVDELVGNKNTPAPQAGVNGGDLEVGVLVQEIGAVISRVSALVPLLIQGAIEPALARNVIDSMSILLETVAPPFEGASQVDSEDIAG